jgi:hypothetical protein
MGLIGNAQRSVEEAATQARTAGSNLGIAKDCVLEILGRANAPARRVGWNRNDLTALRPLVTLSNNDGLVHQVLIVFTEPPTHSEAKSNLPTEATEDNMTKRFPLALAILSCYAMIATAQDFNMKPGLWQFSSIGEGKGDPMSGMSPAEREQMEQAKAHMTPEQRARMEAMMKQPMAAMGTAAKPRTWMACITKENIRKDLARMGVNDPGSTCKTTSIRQTSTVSESREVCSGSNAGSSNTTLLFELPSSETLIGTIHTAMSGGGYEFHLKITGKWMGPACGDVKP